MRLTNLLYSLIVLLLLSHLGFSQYSHISFPIASSELFRDLPNHEPDYTMGVGDINGDGEQDIIIRVWNEGRPRSQGGDDEDFKNFESRMYAYTLEGKKLWEFNTKAKWERKKPGHIIEPCSLAPMTIWDFDKDGKDEVVTVEGTDLVMLGFNNESLEVEHRKFLSNISLYILVTIAFLDGRGNDPYIIIAYAEHLNAKIIVLDKNFNEYKRFDNPAYYDRYPHHICGNLRGFDFDNDGNDELLYGSLILNEDLSIYLDSYHFMNENDRTLTVRSFIADIDFENPGYEWFYIMKCPYSAHGTIYSYLPQRRLGPYLVDVDEKELLWHYDGSQSGYIGWAGVHRGWIGDTHSTIPGLEIWATGQLWKSQDEWNNAFKKSTYFRGKGGKPESWILLDCKGKLIEEELDKVYKAGYPLYWDDDPGEEWFGYRSGELRENYPDGEVIAQFQKHSGSGECTITDFLGDWREEIIITDNHIVHIYSNNEPTKFPHRTPLRKGHNYRIHQASIGNGLPKPYQPDAGWPDL